MASLKALNVSPRVHQSSAVGYKRARSEGQTNHSTQSKTDHRKPIYSFSRMIPPRSQSPLRKHDQRQKQPRGASLKSWHRTMVSSAAMVLFLSCSASARNMATTSNANIPCSPRISTDILAASAFVGSDSSSRSRTGCSRRFMSISRKTPNHRRTAPTIDTWSNAVHRKTDASLNESRFGVRNRVKSVLDKARKRTGIENLSTLDRQPKDNRNNVMERKNGASSRSARQEPFRSGPNVVAETASIGGLGAVGIDDDGNVDVALDYIPADKTSIYPDDSPYIARDRLESESHNKYTAVGSKLSNKASETESKYAAARLSPDTPKAPDTEPSDNTCPEDNLVLASPNSFDNNTDKSITYNSYAERDAFTGDVSAAFSVPREPLPFTLPTLDSEQYARVMKGERVQYQDDMGLAGSGFVVWDVKAPASVVWDCLLDFKSYPQTIPTVREVVMYTNTHLKEDYRAERPLDFEDGTAAICKHGIPSVTRAQFSLSKFRLKIAALHKYRPHPQGDYMIFTLDPASTNMVLKFAKGVWHTQSNPDGKQGYTRVWLLCELKVSRLLPQWIVDYAAARAMPRATTWLKPQVEAAAILWLKDSTNAEDIGR